MSYPFKPHPYVGDAPRKRAANNLLAGMGIAALLAMTQSASAGESTSVKAEVTIGFPHGQVTLERTIYSSGSEDDEDYGSKKIVVNRDEDNCPPEKEVVVHEIVEPAPCDHAVVYEEPVYSPIVIVHPRYRHEIRYVRQRPRFERHERDYRPHHESSEFHADQNHEYHADQPAVRHEEHQAEQHPRSLFNTPSARPSRERGAQKG